MVSRYMTSTGIGTAVTFGLLFLMQYLIATGEAPLMDIWSLGNIDFVRVERTVEITSKRERPKQPEDVKPPPERPRLPGDDVDTGGILVKYPTPPAPPGRGTEGGSLLVEGDLLPVVKVAPVYPARALARGLEGYVIVEFTVTRLGTVKDVAVAVSTNSIFRKAAIEAAYKFRYKPRIIDGEAVEVEGVQNKISFVLE